MQIISRRCHARLPSSLIFVLATPSAPAIIKLRREKNCEPLTDAGQMFACFNTRMALRRLSAILCTLPKQEVQRFRQGRARQLASPALSIDNLSIGGAFGTLITSHSVYETTNEFGACV